MRHYCIYLGFYQIIQEWAEKELEYLVKNAQRIYFSLRVPNFIYNL